MIKLRRFMKDRVLFVIGCMFKLFESIMELFIPLIMVDLMNVGLNNGTPYFLTNVGKLFGIVFLGFAFAFVCQRSAAYIGARFGANLRRELYKHINSLSFFELDKLSSDMLATRLTTDVANVQLSYSMFMRLATRSPFIAIGSIIMAFTINSTIAWGFVVITIIVSAVLYIIMQKSVKIQKNVLMKQFDVVSNQASNAVYGNRVIRSFAKEKQTEKMFDEATDLYRRANEQNNRVIMLLSPITTWLMDFAICGMIIFASTLVNGGGIISPQVTTLLTYMAQLILALTVLANLFATFSRGESSAMRIEQVFNTTSSMQYGQLESLKDNLDIKITNLAFKYQASSGDCLRGINLEIPYGTSLGIVGVTGSGKSTLANLILRNYDAKEGIVTIGGIDIKLFSKEGINGMFAIAPQNTVIFSKSAVDNICFSNDSNKDDVERYAKMAEAHEFIMKSGGYDHMFLEGGKNLSGGQRQRISIARTFARQRKINIFDNTLSALDNKTEKAVRDNIMASEGTKIIISQRLNSVMGLDKIAFMDGGEIVAIGTHEELKKISADYNELAQSQLKEGE